MQEIKETRVQSLGWEDPLEEGMTPHSSIFTWRIPMDRGVWWATVQRIAKSWAGLQWLSMHALMMLNDLYMFSDFWQGFPFSLPSFLPFSFHLLIKYLSSSYYVLNLRTSTEALSMGTEIDMPHSRKLPLIQVEVLCLGIPQIYSHRGLS